MYLRIIALDLHPRLQSAYDNVFGSVRGSHCTQLVPHTRASSDYVDISDLGEWIHLKTDIVLWRMLELDSDDLVLGSRLCPWNPTVALHVFLNLGVKVVLTCLDSLRLPSCARNPYGCAFIFGTYSLVPRGTQIRYSVAVDLETGLGVRIDSTVGLASPPVDLWMPYDLLAHLHNGGRTPLSPPVGYHGCLLTIFRSLLLSSSAGGPYLSGFVPSISAIVESSKLDDVCLSSRHHTFTWEINIKSIKNMGENHRVTKHTCLGNKIRVPIMPWMLDGQRAQRDAPWGSYAQYSTFNGHTLSPPLSPPRPNLEDLVASYINSADAKVKSIKAVQRSQTASIHKMGIQIELLAKMTVERPLANLPNTTKWILKMKRKKSIPYWKSLPPQDFKNPRPNMSVVEERKRDECLTENENEFEEAELKKDILKPENDESENEESYDLSGEDVPSTAPMAVFQNDMRTAFEQLRVTQDTHGA
ncbi:hypothetical protein M9H77_23096 [Catharanthus roseus]|uniref:Uncharacterized protein n=1 Tax=Catharanthus roseus TaxID=4058 RepID=A0ACC0AWD8_CATRO|nr:hypothetical protein M9H77_23096 [Catharanthus roseus]